MSRRTSFSRIMADAARAQARQAREYNKQVKAMEREKAQATKLAKQQYTEARARETDGKNQKLTEFVSELQHVLEYTLSKDDTISFDDLRIHDQFRQPPILKPLPSISRNLTGSKI
jgi:hypothetical protein